MSAPAGFQFLPVGTPELADHCKELSRLRGLPVNVVNAKPTNISAVDPKKISHHVHRIGYHFHSDVLDDACHALGYTYSNKRFVRNADLRAQYENTRMARAMARHGFALDQEPVEQENNEQVREAIKELFPRIPEDDLTAIVKHAWEKGAQRVGTSKGLELPRRVQLATTARIRHVYTDYDRLLRAFEWKEARALVEPTCVKKLIEWRGENEDDNDDELEEIVRETIVIDDDDDVGPPQRGSRTDDEDSAAETDQGYASDTSLEISHKPAAVEDLGAESHDERARKFLDRHQPPPRNVQQRHIDVRQKIGLAREQLRKAPVQNQNVVRVHVPHDQTDGDTIMIAGQRFHRVPPPVEVHRSPVYYAAPQLSPQGITPGSPYGPPQQYPTQQLHSRPAAPSNGYTRHDQPVASIEPEDDLRRKAMASASAQQHNGYASGHRSLPASPQGSSGKRRRLDTNGHNGVQPHAQPQYTSPTDRYADGHRSSTRGAPLPPSSYVAQQPLVRINDDPHRTGNGISSHMVSRSGFVDAQVAPIQYVPLSQHHTGHTGHLPRPPPRDEYHVQSRTGPATRVVYVERPQAGYGLPQPQHGAPAAVQPAHVSVAAKCAPPIAAHYAPQKYYYPG